MPVTPITDDQLVEMIRVSKDIQYRLPGLGMPELDVEFATLIVMMEEAHGNPATPEPEPEPM